VGQLVDTVDSERAAFVERYFHIQWPNRPLYHAMLNTAPRDDIVIHTMLALKKALEHQFGLRAIQKIAPWLLSAKICAFSKRFWSLAIGLGEKNRVTSINRGQA
jgi:hypothetical protein